MFKVNNNDSDSLVLVSLLLTYFTPCSSVSIANFERVTPGWDITLFSPHK